MNDTPSPPAQTLAGREPHQALLCGPEAVFHSQPPHKSQDLLKVGGMSGDPLILFSK